MSRALPIALLAALALLLAGCGGTASTTGAVASDVAELVPADAQLVLALATDPEGEQWRRTAALLDRFPGKSALAEQLHEALSEEGLSLEGDVLAALGDETYVVVLGTSEEDGVVLTQPRDRAKLAELLRESDEPPVTRELNGWTLIADDEQLLAEFGEDGDRLADADWFRDAQDRVEGDALVTILGNGSLVEEARGEATGDCAPAGSVELEYFTGTLTAEEDGLRLLFAASTSGEGADDLVDDGSLLEHVPSGAILYLGAPGFDAAGLGLADQLRCALGGSGAPDAENLLGISYEDVLDLFAGGFALSVRPDTLVPAVSLLLEPEDEARAIRVLDSLVERAGGFFDAEARPRAVGDVEARELTLGPVTILYGGADGRVVITTSESGFDALTGDGGSLEDDGGFRDAREAAGAGDDAQVFGYVDLEQVLALLTMVAAFADEEIPAEVRANLEPLESVLAWGDTSDPSEPEFGLFVALR